jgi:hypothetical protein
MLAQDFEIVAVIKSIFLHCRTILTRIRRLRNRKPGVGDHQSTPDVPVRLGQQVCC